MHSSPAVLQSCAGWRAQRLSVVILSLAPASQRAAPGQKLDLHPAAAYLIAGTVQYDRGRVTARRPASAMFTECLANTHLLRNIYLTFHLKCANRWH